MEPQHDWDREAFYEDNMANAEKHVMRTRQDQTAGRTVWRAASEAW